MEFIIINEKHRCDSIFSHTAWAGYLKPSWTPEPEERPTAYIAILNTQPKNVYVYFDVGIAMAYIVLTAQTLDYGSCILCKINKKEIKKLLKIPESVELKALVALGRKNEIVKREERIDEVKYWRDDDGIFHIPKKPLSSIIHKQRFTSY